MNKWIEIDFKNLIILIVVIFSMILLWNLAIGNHRRDIQRDQYIIDHCKSVKQGDYSFEPDLRCED